MTKDLPVPSPSYSRRETLRYVGAAASCAVLPRHARAAGTSQMQEQIAKHARDLVKGARVTLQLLLPNGSGANVAPVITVFERMTGISVNPVETSVDEINVELLLDTFSNSQRFDIALPATFGLPDLVAANAIQPMTNFARRYEPQDFRDDILFRTGDSFDDTIYGFQTDGDAYVMFYNKAMLSNPIEQARYADNFGTRLEKPMTWPELDRQMAYFNRPDEGVWGGLLFRTPGYLAWEWWVRFHAQGIWPFSPEMEPQIASEAGLAALEDMIRATQSQAPEAMTLGLFQNWERYSQGDIYCNIGWGGSQKYLNGPKSKMRGNMVYGPTPGGVVDGEVITTPYFNWGWNYVIPNNSIHPELAYLFALFAATPEMSTLAVKQPDGFFDPFRPEHYADADIKAAYTTEFLDIHRSCLETAIPDLYLQGQGEYFRILSEWLVRALAGDVTPQVALERVAHRWRLITGGSGQRAQQQRWAQLRDKYPAQLKAVLRDYS